MNSSPIGLAHEKPGCNDVINTLADLVAIDSVNPQWNGPGEARAAEYVRKFLNALDVETQVQEVLPGRCNVLAKLPGRDSTRRVVWEAHLDTVSAGGMDISPFEPIVDDGKLYGRGACDVKAGLAAMLHAIKNLRLSGQPPACDVWFAAVVDEEHLFRGVLALIDELERAPAAETWALVAEPTECQIVTANKGVLRWEIHTRGRAAHSSKPHLGRNAIVDMAGVIQAIQSDGLRLSQRNHPLVGSPTLCISMIEGGTQINFVPERCSISVDRRLVPGEQPNEVYQYYQQLLSELPDIDLVMDSPLLVDAAMETDSKEDVVQAAQRAARKLGLSTQIKGVPFGCDVTKLARAGFPGIIFGPGSIDRAHAAVEYVEIDQVIQATEFYQSLVEEFVL